MAALLSDEGVRTVLRHAKTIAVVGASTKPWRASNDIMRLLLQAGYTVVPVNPAYDEVLGLKCYPDLEAVPGHVDIVDIFRRADEVMPIVESAIAVGADVVWMQSGIVNEQAAQAAIDAGMKVVMDRCIAVEYNLLSRKAL